jgi:antiviral helicase SKI2
VFAEFEPEEVVALLSSFVFQEKTDNVPVLTPSLEKGRDAIIQIATKVNDVQILHQVILSSEDSNDFVSRPRFGLVEVRLRPGQIMFRMLMLNRWSTSGQEECLSIGSLT